MGWYKAHSSLNKEQGSIDLIDRCINCGSEKRIRANITMEFGEGNFNHGPICYDCYNSYQAERIQVANLQKF